MGNWRVRTLHSSVRKRLKEAGVDYSSHRLHSVCRIISYATASLFDSTENSEETKGAVRGSDEISDNVLQGKNNLVELATVVP